MSEEINTVIVADDEPEICEAVCQMVDWEQLGFRLVGSAGNGVDALQMVEQLQENADRLNSTASSRSSKCSSGRTTRS